MNTQDAVIMLAILIGCPIVLGITFYFIDELFKAGQKYKDELDFLKRLKSNKKQKSDPTEKPNWQQKFDGNSREAAKARLRARLRRAKEEKMYKKGIIMFFCLVAMAIMLPLGLLGVVAVIWLLVDIFRQTAEITFDQFNKMFVMGFFAYMTLQTFVGAWSIFQKTRKKEEK